MSDVLCRLSMYPLDNERQIQMYEDYEDEKQYVRELYWESKGLGGYDRVTVEPIVLAGEEISCPKCNRIRDKAIIEQHLPKCSGTGE